MNNHTNEIKQRTYQATMDRKEFKGKEDKKLIKGRPLLSEIDNIHLDRQLTNDLSCMDLDNV